MKRLPFLFLFLFTFFIVQASWSEDSLPSGYGGISLGMSLDETKDALKKNSDFGYHGDRDVSLIPGDARVLIETDAEYGHGSVFLRRCWFQFFEDKLFTITVNINRDKMDYYSVFTTLCGKYGNPDSLDPRQAVWKDDSVTMILEKPLTLKYIDNKISDSMRGKSSVPLSGTEMTREMFLDEL